MASSSAGSVRFGLNRETNARLAISSARVDDPPSAEQVMAERVSAVGVVIANNDPGQQLQEVAHMVIVCGASRLGHVDEFGLIKLGIARCSMVEQGENDLLSA